MPKKILIVSGEPSGDLHASNLVRDLKSLDGSIDFFGIGGELSRKSGVDIVFDITDLALVGVVEVLRHLSVVKKAHDAIISRIDAEKPDLAVLVDYPGFNLKLAMELAGKKIPVVYYISPQLWAWGRQRIHIIKRCVRKMIVFFKFEEELYRSCGIDAEFVGHPLLDIVKASAPKEETLKKYGLSGSKTTIALLPGSRESEIRTFLPILSKAAGIISGDLGGVQFVISKHHGRSIDLYEDALKTGGLDCRLVEGDLHNILAASDFAIVASGTATLETAILGTPLLIVYKANLLTYMLYKLVVTTPYLGIVNVVADRYVCPELLQFDMTPENISRRATDILSDPQKLRSMREDLSSVKSSLGSKGASLRAARAVFESLR